MDKKHFFYFCPTLLANLTSYQNYEICMTFFHTTITMAKAESSLMQSSNKAQMLSLLKSILTRSSLII